MGNLLMAVCSFYGLVAGTPFVGSATIGGAPYRAPGRVVIECPTSDTVTWTAPPGIEVAVALNRRSGEASP